MFSIFINIVKYEVILDGVDICINNVQYDVILDGVDITHKHSCQIFKFINIFI